jgi:sporadic carbohydrate cluster 2OG-Fe(II) oxygenase
MIMQQKYCLLEGPNVLEGVENFLEIVREGIHGIDPILSGVELTDLHTKLATPSINKFRMAVFKYLNASPGVYDPILDKIAGEKLMTILGPDLVVQTKLNISIQLPGDKSSQLDLHSDCWSGDTPFQVNLWIPLTPCFATNSMFLLSQEKSISCICLVNENPTLDAKALSSFVTEADFLELSRGKAIIFNPGLIHGNTTNQTNKTRVSINVRFKNAFAPDAAVEHISRSVGPYYRKFKLSEWTELALNLHQHNRHEFIKC